MTRVNEYTIRSRVRFSEIDHTRKMTLPGIINYFQDCSIFQSEEIGYGLEYLNKQKKAWMLSAWQIVIERYPKLGEEITVSTWASGFKGICGDRNFCMRDEAGEITACANSLWVYMDLQKGRPAKPEADEVEAYGVSKPLGMERAPRKIDIPENMTELQSFPVRRYHIDTNEHVNNCQYVQMAKEVYEGEEPIRQVRAEYKKSAVYNDIIMPRAGREDNRTVVELCNVKGQTFATVEFRA
ncbi:acyl-[acyl-carrier-protein] thioesterase [Lachnospiraceae bacterium MD308]|nr:acyl-[acyl-carrier-protein] thioesterase [Lachnospiraceae bacterium MD308]MCI8579457.1 acyl-[acyl-carrier-protein] thioesterase [Dorea sp.]